MIIDNSLILLFGFCVIAILVYVNILKENKNFGVIIGLLPSLEKKISSGPRIGSLAPNFTLEAINSTSVTLNQVLEKPLILLIVNTECDICSIDIDEFSKESLLYHQFYNYVLVINKDHNLNSKSKTKNKFFTTLYSTPEFLKDYNITLFPTFILINPRGQIAALPHITSQLKHLYHPKHVELVELSVN